MIVISSNVTCFRHDIAVKLLIWCWPTITNLLIKPRNLNILTASILYMSAHSPRMWMIKGSIPGRAKGSTMQFAFVIFPLTCSMKEEERRLIGTEWSGMYGAYIKVQLCVI